MYVFYGISCVLSQRLRRNITGNQPIIAAFRNLPWADSKLFRSLKTPNAFPIGKKFGVSVAAIFRSSEAAAYVREKQRIPLPLYPHCKSHHLASAGWADTSSSETSLGYSRSSWGS